MHEYYLGHHEVESAVTAKLLSSGEKQCARLPNTPNCASVSAEY